MNLFARYRGPMRLACGVAVAMCFGACGQVQNTEASFSKGDPLSSATRSYAVADDRKLATTPEAADVLFVQLCGSQNLVRGARRVWSAGGIYDELDERTVVVELPTHRNFSCVSSWTDLCETDNRVWAVQCLELGRSDADGYFTLEEAIQQLDRDLKLWNIPAHGTLLFMLNQMREGLAHQGEPVKLDGRPANLPPLRSFWEGGQGQTSIDSVAQLDVTLLAGYMTDRYAIRIVFEATNDWITQNVAHLPVRSSSAK